MSHTNLRDVMSSFISTFLAASSILMSYWLDSPISSTTSQQSRILAGPRCWNPQRSQPLLHVVGMCWHLITGQIPQTLLKHQHVWELKTPKRHNQTHIHTHKNTNATTRQNHLTHNKTHDHLTHLQLPFCLQLVNRLLAANAPAPARGLHIAAAPRHRSRHCSRKRKTRSLGVSVGLGLGLGVDEWCRNNADGDFCLLDPPWTYCMDNFIPGRIWKEW